MTLEQLRIFAAVAERLNVTRAAEALGLTQSAVSSAIAALEGRYGVQLFDRVGRGVRLSEAGELFLQDARAALAQAGAAEAALKALAGLTRGRLLVHASQTIAAYWLPPRLARFAEAYPGLDVRLAVGNTLQVTRAVRAGEAELGFVEGRTEGDRLVRRPVGGDRLCLVCAPGHPLAAEAGVTAKDLRRQAFVLREPGSGTRSEFEAGMAAQGLDPQDLDVRLELPSNEAVLAAVASGGLISAVSELAARPFAASGAVLALDLGFPDRLFEQIALQGRRPSAAAAAFLASIEAAA